MSLKEVAVFGAGPAGISTVRGLADKGHDVTWIVPESFADVRSVYTSVNKVNELREIIDMGRIRALPFVRMINDRGADIQINIEGNPYFMLDNFECVQNAVRATTKNYGNVHFESHSKQSLKNISVFERRHDVVVNVSGSSRKFDRVVDATGTKAQIASQVDNAKKKENGNYLVAYIQGTRIRGTLDKPEMMLTLGGQIGSSWISPSIVEGYLDIVYYAWGPIKDYESRFLETADQRLEKLIKFAKSLKGVNIDSETAEEKYSGISRAQPTFRPMSNNTFAVGEAAGMAEPSTGRAFDRSYFAGKILAEAINDGKNPSEFYAVWRKIWNDDLFFAGTMARLRLQKKGDVGGSVTTLKDMSDQSKQNAVLEKAIEWFTKRKLSPEAVLYLLTNPKLLSPYLQVISKYLEIKVKGVEKSGLEWSLPEI